ncbi:MAG: tetratricopeptide repeat protein [Planctomycetota bacterium]|jgi:TPR repeat protein
MAEDAQKLREQARDLTEKGEAGKREAYPLLVRAHELGDPEATYALGTWHLFGVVVEKNLNRALTLIEEAAYEVGRLTEARDKASGDLSEAFKWFRKSAELGYSEAQYAMGRAFEYGEHLPKDAAKAINWYQRAAEQGHEDAETAFNELKAEAESSD